MTKVIEVSNSKEDFEVFDRSSPIESPRASFSDLPPVQVSSNQDPFDVPEAMVLQRKKNTSLLELLETHVGGFTPKVAIQTRPLTPLLAHTSFFEPADKRRKWDKKDKEVFK